MKEATNFYKKNIELVQLEVVSVRISTKDKDSRPVTPLGWLRKIFLQRKRGENYVPPEVDQHFDENRQPGKVYVEATVDTESNIGKFSRSTTAMQWEDEEYVYAKLRFRWIDWPSAEKIDKPVKVQIQFVWESSPFVSVGRQRIVTTTQTAELMPGEEITIVDRMEKSKVDEFRLQPKLIAMADLSSEHKASADENPLADYAEEERQRIARIEAERLAEQKAKEEAERLARMRRAKEEAERLARIRKAKEEAARLAEQKAKEEADRLAKLKAQEEPAWKAEARRALARKKAYFEMLKNLPDIPDRSAQGRRPGPQTKPKRTKGHVMYVFVLRKMYDSQISGVKNIRGTPLYIEDSQVFRAERARREATSDIHRVELPDAIPFDHVRFVPECNDILKKWADAFGDEKPPVQPKDSRRKFTYIKHSQNFPTLEKAQAYKRQHYKALPELKYEPPPAEKILRIKRNR